MASALLDWLDSAMDSEPDFELMVSQSGRRLTVVATLAGAAMIGLALAWTLQGWQAYSAASQRLNTTFEATVRGPTMQEPEMPRPHVKDAMAAAALLQAPVDDWFRILEHCQPARASTRELRMDVERNIVNSTVELYPGSDVTAWLNCLNAGHPDVPWRVAGLVIEQDATGLTNRGGWQVRIVHRINSVAPG